MKVNEELEIVRGANGIRIDGIGNTILLQDGHPLFDAIKTLYNEVKKTNTNDRENIFKDYCNANQIFKGFLLNEDEGFKTFFEEATPEPVEEASPEEKVLKGLNGLLAFFTEFQFTPSFRFVNTLSSILNNDAKNCSKAKKYVLSYFNLMDNTYINEIVEKTKSKEFEEILNNISSVKPTKTVNSRFKIYYGCAGSGKTTLAQKESSSCIVCNASMLPSDLMKDFCFVNGQPSFKPSSLWNAMVNGEVITFDEINLLPYDSLRFLQGLLDGKAEINFEGNNIQIHDGFKIIGTMNLTVNGSTFGLPEPLVDRCEEIKEFKLTAEMLKNAIM